MINVHGQSNLSWSTALDTRGLRTGANRAKGILSGLAGSISAMDIFAGLALSAGIAFTKISKMAYSFSKDFEHSMTEVSTISDAVSKNFNGMSDTLIEMSKTGPENAMGLSTALYQIVSAGYDGAEALDVLKVSADLAIAGVTDTQTAADGITYVMNAFGEAAGNAENVAAKMFQTVKLGKTKMEELGPAVSKVAGLWAQAGGSFDDMMATIAEGVKKLPIDIMTTGIRGMMNAIIAPSDQAKETIAELGIEFDAATLKSKGFTYILDQMWKAVGDNDDKMEKLAAIFPNVRGLIGALAIEGEGFKETLDAMADSTADYTSAVAKMTNDTTNQYKILMNNLTAKFKPWGDKLLKFVGGIVKDLNKTLSKTGNVFEDLANNWDDAIEVMRGKRNAVRENIKTIEELGKKSKLTREETTDLNSAEKQLAIYLPEVTSAMESGATAAGILEAAKRGVLNIDKETLEFEKRVAEMKVKASELEIKIFEQGKNTRQEELKDVKEKFEAQESIVKKRAEELANYLATGKTPLRMQSQTTSVGTITGLGEISKEEYEQELKDQNIALDSFIGKNYGLAEITEKVKAVTEEYINAQNDYAIATGQVANEEERLNLQLEKRKIELEGIGKVLETPTRTKTTTQSGGGKVTPAFVGPPEPALTDMSDIGKYYDEWLSKHQTFEEQKYNITEEYNKLREEARLRYEGEKEEAELKRIDLAEEAEKQKLDYAIERYEKEELLRKQEYSLDKKSKDALASLSKDLNTMRVQDIKDHISQLQDLLKTEELTGEQRVAIYERISAAQNKLFSKLQTKIISTQKAFDGLIGILKQFTGESSELAEGLQYLSDGLGNLQRASSSFASGDDMGGYAELIDAAGNTIELFTKTWDKFEKKRDAAAEKRREKIKQEMSELENIGLTTDEYLKDIKARIDLKIESGDIEGIRTEILALHNYEQELQTSLQEAREKGWTETSKKLEDDIKAIQEAAERMWRSTINNITQTTSELIADSLIDGLLEGKRYARDFVNDFETMMSTALVNSFKTKYLMDEMDRLQMLFASYMENIFMNPDSTPDEVAQWMLIFKNDWTGVMTLMGREWDAFVTFMKDVGGIDIEEILGTDVIEDRFASMRDTISDAIINGFEEGQSAIDIFHDVWKDSMHDMIMDVFKDKILTDSLERWFGNFSDKLSSGDLSSEDMYAMSMGMQDIISGAGTAWENMKEVLSGAGVNWEDYFGIAEDAATDSGLAGAIAGITEDTAGLLAGQLGNIQVNVIESTRNVSLMADTLMDISSSNAIIAENTSVNPLMLSRLESIDSKLSNKSLRSVGL